MFKGKVFVGGLSLGKDKKLEHTNESVDDVFYFRCYLCSWCTDTRWVGLYFETSV